MERSSPGLHDSHPNAGPGVQCTKNMDEILSKIQFSPSIPPRWLLGESHLEKICIQQLENDYRACRRKRYMEAHRLMNQPKTSLGTHETAAGRAKHSYPYITEEDKPTYRIPKEVVRSSLRRNCGENETPHKN
ncbi:unnamed protein product [Calicophoron daubneyi]|uniref:Uncharacterized protein n=1 Tax=Calicophoron daubneyi TaxID=300641 RepID=A0AAV2TAH5_CALDB